MSSTHSKISDRILRMLEEIEACDQVIVNSASNCNSSTVTATHKNTTLGNLQSQCQSFATIHQGTQESLHSSNKSSSQETVRNNEGVSKDVDGNLEIIAKLDENASVEIFDTLVMQPAKRAMAMAAVYNTVPEITKFRSFPAEDVEDKDVCGLELASVTQQLESILESQDAILADIRMDMEQLHVDNLALRQSNAKLLAEKNHYEKLYKVMCYNLKSMRDHIRQLEAFRVSDHLLEDASINDPNFCITKATPTFPTDPFHLPEKCGRLSYDGRDPQDMDNIQTDELNQAQNHNLSVSNIVNNTDENVCTRQNSVSALLGEPGTENVYSSSPKTYATPKSSETTYNKKGTVLPKPSKMKSQTSEISQTESTVTPTSCDSTSRINNSNTSSSNGSTPDSISQTKSSSHKNTKKGRLSRVKIGCFEFFRKKPTKNKHKHKLKSISSNS